MTEHFQECGINPMAEAELFLYSIKISRHLQESGAIMMQSLRPSGTEESKLRTMVIGFLASVINKSM